MALQQAKKRNRYSLAAAIFLLVITLLLTLATCIRFLTPPNKVFTTPYTPSAATSQVIPAYTHSFLFVPHWTMYKQAYKHLKKTNLVYFGLKIDESGVVKTNTEYQRFIVFAQALPSKDQKFFTIAVTNHAQAERFMADEALQDKVIKEAVNLAKEYGFRGVVWDIELQPELFSQTNKNNLTRFFAAAQKVLAPQGLSQFATVYGDTFYRGRPYNVQELVQYTDGVLFMVYDLYKSTSESGPLFPLGGSKTYGYDVAALIKNLEELKIPKEKTIFVWGAYGYKWKVDPQTNLPLERGRAVTLGEYEAEIAPFCERQHCETKNDTESGSRRITFTQGESTYVLWIDTASQLKEKIAAVQKKGYASMGFWAYGYFSLKDFSSYLE